MNGNDIVKGTVWSFTVDQSVPVIAEHNNSAGNSSVIDVMHRNDQWITINYNFGSAAPVTCALFDIQGKEVVIFPVTSISEGVHSASFDLKQARLATGMYMIRLVSDKDVLTAPVMVK